MKSNQSDFDTFRVQEFFDCGHPNVDWLLNLLEVVFLLPRDINYEPIFLHLNSDLLSELDFTLDW